MKIVIDTNVIIAAFASHGLCHIVFEAILANHEMVVSPQLLQEVQSNLKKKIKLPDDRVKDIVDFLKFHAKHVLKDSVIEGVRCRDPGDIKILSLAIQSKADAIVTGDQDLLVLKKIRSTVIVSPREFWDILRKTAP